MYQYRVFGNSPALFCTLSRFTIVAVAILLSTSVIAGYVDLKVTGAGANAKLEIDDSDVKCGNNKNCIQTTRGQFLDLDFKLKNACGTNGPVYKLSGMQLSLIQRQPDPGNPRNSIKAFGRYVMPAIVTSDFDTDASGNVLWNNTGRNNNKLTDSKIKIKDKNDGEYVVFFNIKAVPCDPASSLTPIYLDPRIENTGTN